MDILTLILNVIDKHNCFSHSNLTIGDVRFVRDTIEVWREDEPLASDETLIEKMLINLMNPPK